MENSNTAKICSAVLTVCTALFIVTGAIAVPVLFRTFYHAHIVSMKLAEKSGMTEEQIRQAFGDVMDYCIGREDSFSAGILQWSQAGADHFADVRELFIADFWAAGISFAVLSGILIYCSVKGISLYHFKGHGPGFWSAAAICITAACIAGASAINFDLAFEVFHKVFFPGKDNWILYYDTDPVILILPQEFFRNCAILILGIIIISCAVLIVSDQIIQYRHRRKHN